MSYWNPSEWTRVACDCGGCNPCGFNGRAGRPLPPEPAVKPAIETATQPTLFDDMSARKDGQED